MVTRIVVNIRIEVIIKTKVVIKIKGETMAINIFIVINSQQVYHIQDLA